MSNGNQQNRNGIGAVGNNVAGNQGQNVPPQIQARQRPAKTLPEENLQVRNGTVASFSSRYNFSKEAIDVLRSHFSHLLIGEDKHRLSIGGNSGFIPHGHALGATLRAYYDDLVLYKHAPNGKVLDVGGSMVRTLSRYQFLKNGRKVNAAFRVWSQTPVLDVRDDLRVQDNKETLVRKVNEHNEIETDPDLKLMIEGGLVNRVDALTLSPIPLQCRCAMAKSGLGTDINCACSTERYDTIKSVESWYYPGVMEGMFNRLIRDKSVGYVVCNDYYRMLLRQKDNKESVLGKKLAAISCVRALNSDFGVEAIGHGCLNHNLVPESTHTVLTEKGKLIVKAEVQGNPMPYVHGFPKTADSDSFAYTFVAREHDDFGNPLSIGQQPKMTEYLMLFEKVEEIMNGDIPFVLYKVRATLKSRWGSILNHVPVLPFEFATVHDILNDATPSYIDQWVLNTTKQEEEVKVTEKKTPKMADPEPVEQDLVLFDEDLYVKKTIEGGEKRVYSAEMKSALENERQFVRWIKRQVFDRNHNHHFSVKVVKGKAYLVLRKYTRSFFGLIVSTDASLSAMAPVSDVVDAYCRIGVKSNAVAIQQSCVQKQRDAKNQDHKMFTDAEAFLIARYIRAVETARFNSILA